MSFIENRDFIQRASEENIKKNIRERLTLELRSRVAGHVVHSDLSKDHLRFDMSGYGRPGYNDCYFDNLEILKLFTDYGIWDFVEFLYLDAYKGNMKLCWKWWINSTNDESYHELDLSCLTTTEIIYQIIKTLSVEPRELGWDERRFF